MLVNFVQNKHTLGDNARIPCVTLRFRRLFPTLFSLRNIHWFLRQEGEKRLLDGKNVPPTPRVESILARGLFPSKSPLRPSLRKKMIGILLCSALPAFSLGFTRRQRYLRNMNISTLAFAFMLTLLAGLATGIGSLLAFFAKRTNTRFLCISLGFSAGVMTYVSFMEILPQGRESLVNAWGLVPGSWAAAAAFFAGIALIALIDTFVPEGENPHEPKLIEEMENAPRHLVVHGKEHDPESLKRTGIFTALALAIHNFPEGLATFTAAISEPQLGLAIAIAIAIHNIPEGIAVSAPIYYATGSRRKAFIYSFASGLAEPVGALVGYLLILPFFSPAVFGLLFAGVAGIMVYISIDELLPTAEEYGEHHLCIYGFCGGMALMAFSLLLIVVG